ncbi:MAG: hypothetical protein JWQ11_1164, partial [Rhizobacter sp.]|nr:hypothetical protein [Rhizobacter sp.]
PGGRTSAGHSTADSLQMCAPAVLSAAGGGAANQPPVVEHQPLNDLVATIQAPGSARPGSVLHYLVTLGNPTRRTITLEPCPSYVEAAAGSKGTYQLNCAHATAIAPGEHESFQMDLHISTGASAGPATLTWTLALITEGGTSPDSFHDAAPLMIT